MVAEEHDDPTTRRARLLLEAHQEVEHRARLEAAIEDVAHLHEDPLAPGPVAGTVQEPGDGQDAHQVVVGSVDVADRDHTRSARDPARALCGERARDEGERSDRQEGEGAARGQAIEGLSFISYSLKLKRAVAGDSGFSKRPRWVRFHWAE